MLSLHLLHCSQDSNFNCSLIFTVTEEDEIWRRDCFHSEDGFVGCKGDQRNNGTIKWDIEYCVCDDENGCNEKMGEIPTSSTPSTTTHIGNTLRSTLYVKQ